MPESHSLNKQETRRQPERPTPKTSWVLSGLLFIGAWGCPPGYADEVASQPIAGSITVSEHVNKAAKYWEMSDYVHARDEFRKVIRYSPTLLEGYEGLMSCCEKTREWPQVAFACEKIFGLDAQLKRQYEYDYGLALYNMN